MKNIVLVLIFLLTGCETFTVTSGMYQPIGDTRSNGFQGDGFIFVLEGKFERQYTENLSGYCSLMHTSNVLSGPPFNNDQESYINAVGCGGQLTFDISGYSWKIPYK